MMCLVWASETNRGTSWNSHTSFDRTKRSNRTMEPCRGLKQTRCWNTFLRSPDAKRMCSILVQTAFLTCAQIEVVSPLLKVKMSECGLENVWNSFARTFLSRRFPPEMWCAQRISNRTNNRCESFHSSFVKSFPVHSGRPSFGEVVICINMALTDPPRERDCHPSRTSQLERENRAIEQILVNYADCLDSGDIFKCLELLAARKTDLLIDLDEINSRMELSMRDELEIDLECQSDTFDEQPLVPACPGDSD